MAGRGPEKFLTLSEANRALPEIEEHLQIMDRLVAERRDVADLVEDMEAYWGEALREESHAERGEYEELRRRLAALESDLEGRVVRIHDLGGHLKSHEQGLVDFYAIREGRVVFLCWQRGEEKVAHYHELDAGFPGRKPLTG